jgi:hypothetical protein
MKTKLNPRSNTFAILYAADPFAMYVSATSFTELNAIAKSINISKIKDELIFIASNRIGLSGKKMNKDASAEEYTVSGDYESIETISLSFF